MPRSFKTKLVQLLRRITARFSNRYRPELHYMRGPGPKSLGKKRALDRRQWRRSPQLALTAPREERGREIRRIAMTLRRARRFFRGIRVRLHHLPIKMPGGMTEHGQNDS